MDGSSTTNKNKFKFSMIFPDRMNRLWTILKDSNKVLYILSKTQTLLPNVTIHNLKCSELITNNYYKAISYTLDRFLLKFSIYPNTLENSSLVIHEIISQRECNSSLPENYLEQSSKHFLESLSKYLKENPFFLYEYQSILFQCDVIKIWNFLVNESNYSFDFINNKINSVKNKNMNSQIQSLKKEGDKFLYKFGASNGFNETKYAIVTKIEQDFIKKQWYFSFDLYHSSDYLHPYCTVNFFLLIIKDNQIFLTFQHDFKESIEQKQLNILTQEKKIFLNLLKKYFEEISYK